MSLINNRFLVLSKFIYDGVSPSVDQRIQHISIKNNIISALNIPIKTISKLCENDIRHILCMSSTKILYVLSYNEYYEFYLSDTTISTNKLIYTFTSLSRHNHNVGNLQHLNDCELIFFEDDAVYILTKNTFECEQEYKITDIIIKNLIVINTHMCVMLQQYRHHYELSKSIGKYIMIYDTFNHKVIDATTIDDYMLMSNIAYLYDNNIIYCELAHIIIYNYQTKSKVTYKITPLQRRNVQIIVYSSEEFIIYNQNTYKITKYEFKNNIIAEVFTCIYDLPKSQYCRINTIYEIDDISVLLQIDTTVYKLYINTTTSHWIKLNNKSNIELEQIYPCMLNDKERNYIAQKLMKFVKTFCLDVVELIIDYLQQKLI